MSVQLILYPQRQNTTNEFLVDGINFTSMTPTASSYGTSSIQPSNDAVSLGGNPALILNTWYTYYTSGGSWDTTIAPLAGGGQLGLLSFGNRMSGVYQRLSGLTMGQSYTVTINTYIGDGTV